LHEVGWRSSGLVRVVVRRVLPSTTPCLSYKETPKDDAEWRCFFGA
jgi:hypothetical protein